MEFYSKFYWIGELSALQAHHINNIDIALVITMADPVFH